MKKILYTFAKLFLTLLAFVSCGGVEDDSNTTNGFEYVDLDLPSHTKWATCNIGAKNEESVGTYFAWGEVTESNYTELECDAYNRSVADLRKYGIIYVYNLTSDYDAATHNLGTGWKMPTKSQFEELVANCTWVWQDKPAGYKVIGKNGNAIFLPTTGYMTGDGNLNHADQGYYWTSEIEDNSLKNALGFGITASDYEIHSYYRDNGRCIRAVTY